MLEGEEITAVAETGASQGPGTLVWALSLLEAKERWAVSSPPSDAAQSRGSPRSRSCQEDKRLQGVAWAATARPGTLTRIETLIPPADSPKMVTEPGSPPKLAMFSWTQRSAATWSK